MSVHLFASKRLQSPPTRQAQLHGASSEAEVVTLAREFLASISPYDLARIPESCRPGKLVDADDITDYAFTLARHDRDGGEGAARCLRRLANFFSAASIQLAKIMARGNQDANDRRRSA